MPSRSTSALRATLRGAAAGLALALSAVSAGAQAEPAQVMAVPGKPVLMLAAFDLSKLGYRTDEYFLSGTAMSYKLSRPAMADGRWAAVPDANAPFVVRPDDPRKFNGTVLVEWLNVTAGQDTPADWMLAHRGMIRKGFAYVAVSAQKVGVEGGDVIMASGGLSLKNADPYLPTTEASSSPEPLIAARAPAIPSFSSRRRARK